MICVDTHVVGKFNSEALAYATVNRKTFSKLAGGSTSITMLNLANSSAPLDIIQGNNQIITPDSPAVLKIRDSNGREILIKNLKDNTSYEIVAGTPEALVDALVDDPDLSYLEVFLLTFRHFMTPMNLLKRLQLKFEQSNLELDSPIDATQVVDGNLPSMVMHRMVSLLKKWVRNARSYIICFMKFMTDFHPRTTARSGNIRTISFYQK